MQHFAIAVRADKLTPVYYLLAECGVRLIWSDAWEQGRRS